MFSIFPPRRGSIDLKSMQAEHGNDIVPPSTRSLNYIALRYSEFPPEIMVSDYSLASLCWKSLHSKVTNLIHVWTSWTCFCSIDLCYKLISFWFWLIFMQNIGVKDNRFCYRYVVVFQYGSAVLFNIADHEAEYYLDIIRKHASGWLPEMRKDGKPSLPTAKLRSVDCFLLASIFVFLDNICFYRKQYNCLL